MAKRPSVKEILEAARKSGPARPQSDEQAPPETETAAASAAAEPHPAAEEIEATAAPPPPVPSPASLGRPLTLQEKLAAARAGGAPRPTPAASASVSASTKAPAGTAEPATETPEPAAAQASQEVPSPSQLGRPLTLQEKLAAARAGAAKPAAGKPAPTKAASAAAATQPAAAARPLPPLEKITDPRDLAEALRRAAALKAKQAAAPAAPKDLEAKTAAAPAKAAVPPKPQTVPPRPKKPAPATAAVPTSRRGFMIGGIFISWIAVAWTAFTAGMAAFTAMLGRFMFPNVLAEPPSTIKVGLPSNYDPEDVNERFKAEWGFWIVRSTRYNGQDIIYALQTVCTHLGCPPNWLANEQKFKCPCHGSGFYITGINFEGPAPRPLERFKVALADDGQIVVDKSQKFQQELGQWSDPDSFIPV